MLHEKTWESFELLCRLIWGEIIICKNHRRGKWHRSFKNTVVHLCLLVAGNNNFLMKIIIIELFTLWDVMFPLFSRFFSLLRPLLLFLLQLWVERDSALTETVKSGPWQRNTGWHLDQAAVLLFVTDRLQFGKLGWREHGQADGTTLDTIRSISLLHHQPRGHTDSDASEHIHWFPLRQTVNPTCSFLKKKKTNTAKTVWCLTDSMTQVWQNHVSLTVIRSNNLLHLCWFWPSTNTLLPAQSLRRCWKSVWMYAQSVNLQTHIALPLFWQVWFKYRWDWMRAKIHHLVSCWEEEPVLRH